MNARTVSVLLLGGCAGVFGTPERLQAQGWTWSIEDINPSQSTLDAMNPNGASGGRVNGLARAPNGTTYFAASEWGGLFRTTDSGVNWTHLDGHTPHATWDVEVDPGNANRVYATSFYDSRVSSRAGISISVDGGNTWARPASATPPNNFCNGAARRTEPAAFGIAIDPANNAHVFVGTNCGLARSTDSGANWAFVDPTPGDGGADDVWDVVVHDGGIIDLCGDDGHLRSTDNGATWTTAAIGIPAGQCSIAVSPDEADVLFVVTGTSLRESDNGGATWSAPFTNPGAQGRIPFAVVNQRTGATFDLYFGDTQLWRATCTTPAAPGAALRCPTNAWTTVQTGAHWDVGDLAFVPGVAQDTCPILFSNDGGVYRNTLTTSPGCHTPNWEQAITSTHGLWAMGMDGADQAGTAAEDLYFGNQDTGSFASTNASATPPTWTNRDCCDAHDVAAEDNQVLYSVCCFGGGRANRLFLRNQGMAGGAEINAYPTGTVQSFSQTDSVIRFGVNRYTVLTGSGVFVTTDVTANPIVWTQLGAATTPANVRAVQVALASGTPTFVVMSGNANGRSQDRLFRHVGAASGGAWAQINPPNNQGGFGIYAVDPTNANRLIVSHLRTGQAPRMLRTNDGGTTWLGMIGLDTAMTRNGAFLYANTRGPASRLPNSAAMGFIGYPQPTLAAFDPADTNIQVAGAADAGLFITFNNGATWTTLTDTETPGTSGTPHIPRPWYAYFDHEGSTFITNRLNLYIGTQGRGVWRIALSNRPFVIRDVCARYPRVCTLATLRERAVILKCASIPGCIVRDPIPKNCLVKYPCPGCPPGGLCPPYYHFHYDIDPQRWDVTIVDRGGRYPEQQLVPTSRGVVLSFRPAKAGFKEGQIGDYEVVFALRGGFKGENVTVPARLEVSDRPYRRRD